MTISGWRCDPPGVHGALQAHLRVLGHQFAERRQAGRAAAAWNSRWPICSWISSQVFRSSSNIDWFCSTPTLMFFVGAVVMMNATIVGGSGIVLQPLVQPVQRLDEQVHPLVAILVAAAGEEIERAVQVERVAGEEMPHHEFVDPLLVLPMQVLELVRRGEALDVQAVGQDRIRLCGRAVSRLRRAVTSLTVVKTVDACAAAFSI